jgi:AGCS family alanine or glycine:cation symporter
MGAVYMVAGLIVLVIFYQNIPSAIVIIIESAFTLEAGFGALLGSILFGVQRAAFSNEAGLGSSPIVHCTAKTDSPVSQGFVAMLGPFIDTVVICTMTALVIVVTGAYANVDGMSGVDLTSNAFASGISWFPYVLALTVFLFAYSTMITWSYYGEKALTYLFGENRTISVSYKLAFCFFVIVGASAELSSILSFTDAMILSMGIPNIIGLYILAPEIKRELKAYVEKMKAQGIRI